MQPLIENSDTDVSSKEMESKTSLDMRFEGKIQMSRIHTGENTCKTSSLAKKTAKWPYQSNFARILHFFQLLKV